MLLPVHLSPVCLSLVTLVHPTQAIVISGNFSTAFECWTLRLQDISPTGHFAYDMDTSPNGHFAYWTVRLRHVLPTGHFAYSVDSSPTQREHKRVTMCDIHCVPKNQTTKTIAVTLIYFCCKIVTEPNSEIIVKIG